MLGNFIRTKLIPWAFTTRRQSLIPQRLSILPYKHVRATHETSCGYQYSNLGGYYNGKWFCTCGLPAGWYTVKKTGSNMGKKCKFHIIYALVEV